jgi:hypothetical protein
MLEERGFDNEHPRSAIGEHPGVLRRRKTPIERNEHCAKPGTREQQYKRNRIVEP